MILKYKDITLRLGHKARRRRAHKEVTKRTKKKREETHS